jgi:diguanylate cyclase (GGDEF)-like protein
MAIRYGGEEFLILLLNSTEENSLKIAQKINKKFAQEVFSAENKTFKKTLSIGISHYPKDADTLWKAIKYADEALYEAKNSGRDKVVEFKSHMHKEGEDY